ncbi:hypothetical protein MHU86_10396 [Fragilaria crotonensis]|nr:hypothetical protein MHU86_10396 [Fragilaria crotonensis]
MTFPFQIAFILLSLLSCRTGSFQVPVVVLGGIRSRPQLSSPPSCLSLSSSSPRHAFVSATQRCRSANRLRHSFLSSSAPDGDEEFFNFEPDDSDLAKLGEELGDLEAEEDEDVDDTALVVPDVSVIQPLGFVDVFRDDDDDDVIDGDDDTIDDFTYEEDDDDDYLEGEDDDDNDDDDEEWDELSDDEDYDYELEDDDDPNYMIQKKRIEERMAKLDQEDLEMAARERDWGGVVEAFEGEEERFEDYQLLANFNAEAIESGEEEPRLQWNENIADKVKQLLSKNDLITVVDADLEDMANSFNENRGPDDPLDPYEAADKEIDEELKKAEFQRLTQGAVIDELESLRTTKYDGNTPKSNFMDMNHVAEIGMESVDAFRDIPENLKDEIRECMTEMGSASYNVTKRPFFLSTGSLNYKYANATNMQGRNFSFTWEDSKNADMEELYTYYRGFGYNEIPLKAPGDTGIVDLEELDEDEVQMVDFASWCQEVYNPEWDRKDFDDDDIKDVDNVFSPEFILPQDPDVPTYQDAKDDIRNWYGEIENNNDGDVSPEQAEYRDMVGQELDYKYLDDKEFTEAFRGHLVVACTTEEEDLDVAEKITIRFEEEFGKQIYVETRVISHALMEDNCFEVWLESYDIELLHSKKRATTGAKDWDGPIECNDDEINKMVERVAFLISDDARYSYRMDMGAILS